MMKSPIPLRRRPVLWLLLPALPLLFIVANASEPSSSIPGYWTWTVAHSVLLILVPAGVAATGAALEAARLRARREENAAATRSPILVLLDAILPSLLAGVVLQAVAVLVVALGSPGGSSHFPVAMAVTIGAIIGFHTGLGFLLGSAMRPVVAVPLALVASFCWLGYTGSLSWAAPRHLAGLVIETCCGFEAQPATASLVAAAVFSLVAGAGVLVASWALLRLGTSMSQSGIVTGAALAMVALIAGLAVAKDLGPTADAPRDRAALECAGEAPEVCLYPEQISVSSPPDGDIRLRIGRLVQRLEETGIAMPTRVIAAWESAAVDEWALTYHPDMTERDIAAALASTVYDPDPGRCGGVAGLIRYEAADVLNAILFNAMLDDLSSDDLLSTTSADPELLDVYFATASDQQRQWVAEAATSLEQCDGEVPRVPGGRAWSEPTSPAVSGSETNP